MRLPNSYGSVYRMPGTRRKPYAVLKTIGYDENGKQIKKYIGYYKTKSEALKALAAYNQSPFDLTTKDITFAELYKAWGDYKYKGEIPKSYRAAFGHCQAIHDAPFNSLRKRHLQGVIDSIQLKRPTLAVIKGLFHALYKFAIDQELIATNHAQFVELPKQKQSDKHKPFSDAEIETLWQHTDDELVCVALLLIYTGMRPSELIAIKTEDVHINERYMTGGLKTAAGRNRVIPIADKILPIIERVLQDSTDKLLPNLTYQRLRNHWLVHPLLKAHFPHDGRHTCATLMDNADINLKSRQLILGHTSGDITNKVYTHKTIQQLVDAINRI